MSGRHRDQDVTRPHPAGLPIRVQKTFDDDYGRHALVFLDGEIEPPLGRVDVLMILEKNGGARLHPSRVREDYRPTHAKGVL